ncbi:MAG: gliding motility-associated C-terminal domain-containing protein, partial [Bacteroidia bacterium]|nr:gliding motility-associated C-terminal domain-containing protein [Bacteroidia bacterium]
TVGYDSVLNIDLGPDTAICSGQGVLLDAYRPGDIQYTWMDGSTDSARFVTTPGLYWVELSNFCGVERDTIIISQELVPVVNLGNDTTLCLGDTLALDATNSNATYLWQDNSTGPTFEVLSQGLYWARSENICGVDRDSIIVTYIDAPQPFTLGNDTILCNANTWPLNVTQPNIATYAWQNGSALPTFTVGAAGVYRVTLTNQCGTAADTVLVDYDLTPMVDLGPDTTLCLGTPYFRNVAWSPYTTYLWQDNSTAPTYTITTAGTYSVTLTNSCGTANDALVVNYLAPPVDPNLGRDTILCGNATITLSSGLSGYAFSWQDGTTTPTYRVTSEGTYVLTVSNRCGTQRDSIIVRYENIPDISLGNDTTLCERQTLLFNVSWSRASYRWENGLSVPIRIIDGPGRYEVTVTNLCGEDRDVIDVDYLPYPQAVDLGGDQTLCQNETLLLDAFQPGFSYQWQNGSQEPDFLVRFAGTYSVRVSNVCGVEVDQITINYQPRPEVDLGEDQVLCNGAILRLDGTSPTPNVTYRWNDGITSPIRSIEEVGSYELFVSNSCDTVSDVIEFTPRECNCLIHMPSGFTPNGDGVNELFTWAYSCDLQNATLRIYDRWGGEVFSSNDPAAGWNGSYRDGRPCTEGVYVWVLDYGFIGISDGPIQTQESGTVTLLR